MEHTVRVGAVLLAACAALAACTSSSSTAAGTTSQPAAVTSSSSPATSTQPAPTSTPAASPSTSSAPAATTKPAPTTKPVAAPAPVLVLEPDGLGYVVGESSVRHLKFGTDAATVRTVVAKALGGKLTVNDLPECGQGPRTSAGRAGFTVLVDGTSFVGWTDQGAKGRRLTTLDGLGIGSTWKAVQESLPGATVADGSLGAEFTDDGGFGGILAGMSPSSKVTLLYAGETCFFR